MIFKKIFSSKIEIIYWIFVCICLVGFVIDQEAVKLSPHGYYEWKFQDHHSFLWGALILFLAIISSVIVFRWIIYSFLNKEWKNPIWLHAIFTICCIWSFFNINQLRVVLSYVHSIYYARESASCQVRAKKTGAVSICYQIFNDPYLSAIVIDPNHETQMKVHYLGEIPSVAKALKEQDATDLGNCLFSSVLLRDNIYFISASYF